MLTGWGGCVTPAYGVVQSAVVGYEIDDWLSPSKRHGTYLIFILISATALCGQTGNNGAVGSGSLQQHYKDAQELQRMGQLSGGSRAISRLSRRCPWASWRYGYGRSAGLYPSGRRYSTKLLPWNPIPPLCFLTMREQRCCWEILPMQRHWQRNSYRNTRAIVRISLKLISCLDAHF